MFRLQKISNYGTSTPAMARTFAQGCDLLNWFDCAPERIEGAKGVLLELQRHALRCTEDALEAELKQAVLEAEQLQTRQPAGTKTLVLPGVGDLQGRAEAFLRAAKLAVAATGDLTRPFYNKGFGHNYRRFAAWAETQFGPEDDFTRMVASWEPFACRVSDMRNAVDHPKDEPGGRLLTSNFTAELDDHGNPFLAPPRWTLLGEELQPMLPSFEQAIESILVLGENVLVRLFDKLKRP